MPGVAVSSFGVLILLLGILIGVAALVALVLVIVVLLRKVNRPVEGTPSPPPSMS